ncbi:MAG: hypothetical protein PVI23_07955 [Maricaulaceae bacterium]|jgi:hypothetical protein
MPSRWIILALSTSLVACMTEDAPETDAEGFTSDQRAAYDQCLQDNMAVATAWELIEESCRREVLEDPDPLKLNTN